MDNEADLKSFVDAILRQLFEGYSEIEMSDVQELALHHKVLKMVTMTEPCGDTCACAEYIGVDEFPLPCFRKNYEPNVREGQSNGN